jgi:hypothetical protein
MDDGTDGWMERIISSRCPLLYVISVWYCISSMYHSIRIRIVPVVFFRSTSARHRPVTVSCVRTHRFLGNCRLPWALLKNDLTLLKKKKKKKKLPSSYGSVCRYVLLAVEEGREIEFCSCQAWTALVSTLKVDGPEGSKHRRVRRRCSCF